MSSDSFSEWPCCGGVSPTVAREAPERVDLDPLGRRRRRAGSGRSTTRARTGRRSRSARRRGSAPRGPPGRDRPDRPEQLRGERVERVAAQPHLLDADARELGLALGQVVLDVLGDVGLDRHVRVGQLRVAAARPRSGSATGARRRSRRSGSAVAWSGIPSTGRACCRGRCRGAGCATASSAPARPAGRAARSAPRSTAAVDEHVAAAVEDLAARRGHVEVAHPVDLRLGQVLVAREHLQEPQAEEDDREQRQRDAADDRDPQRELRRQRRPTVLGGLDHRSRSRSGWSGGSAEPLGRAAGAG